MFIAQIAACFMVMGLAGPAPKCLLFQDNRGPYETEAGCEERLDEMGQVLVKIAPGPILQMKGRCVPEGDGA